MKSYLYSKKFTGLNLLSKILFSAIAIALTGNLQAQLSLTPKLSDFTLYSGNSGTGITLIGSSITINNGAVGANNTVQTTGNATINAPILSGNNVILTNSNVVKGNIYARGSSGTVISIGSSLALTGSLYSLGNISVGGGSISGSVTTPGSYAGPTPGGGFNNTTPSLPSLPDMPGATGLSGYPAAVTTPQTIDLSAYPITSGQPSYGNYGNINFSGNKTITFNGPGVYIFNKMVMTGNTNKFVFDFGTNPTGKFYVYIRENADLGKLNASTLNGPAIPASNIYIEVLGNAKNPDGSVATSVPGSSFIIANGSGGGSKMLGTVYAPNAAISIGSGTGTTSLTGALYSKYAISIQSGVTINYAAFDFCIPPTAVAGTAVSTCSNSAPVNITAGSSANNQASVVWSSSGTGTFANATSLTTATYTPSEADKTAGSVTLTLTATGSGTCGNATSTKTLTITAAPTAVAGTAVLTCSNSGAVNIAVGSSATNQASVTWSSSGTGTFANANSLTTATYAPSAADKTAGSVTLTLTAIGNGTCGNATSTKTLTITAASTAVAGTAISTCSNSGAVNITAGSSATNMASVVWSSSGTGTFANVNSLTTATYTPSAADITAGSVTLTLTAIGNAPCANATSTKTLTIVAQPTTANAGPDQIDNTTCGKTSVTLAANSPSAGTGNWSIQSGTGGTVTTPSSPT